MITIAGIKFYDTKEVSKMLKISLPTVRNYINSGKLKGQKIGRPFLVSEESIQYFLSSGVRTQPEHSERAL